MSERNTDRLPLTRPALGTWPATQACALTRNQTGKLSVHSLALNPLSHTSRGQRMILTTRCKTGPQKSCQNTSHYKIEFSIMGTTLVSGSSKMTLQTARTQETAQPWRRGQRQSNEGPFTCRAPTMCQAPCQVLYRHVFQDNYSSLL